MILLSAMSYYRRKVIVLTLTAFLSACASAPVDQIALMPAPDVYGDGLLNPLPETNPFDRIPYDGILFATAITLILGPANVLIVNDIREFLRKRKDAFMQSALWER